MNKACPRCGSTDNGFYRDRSKADGLTRLCKRCHSADVNRYVARNREKYNARKRKWRTKNAQRWETYSRQYKWLKRFNITEAEFKALCRRQRNRCAICRKPPVGGFKFLSVDHCHKTKKIRGLLCLKCNTGIGQFGDNVRLLRRALKYLGG